MPDTRIVFDRDAFTTDGRPTRFELTLTGDDPRTYTFERQADGAGPWRVISQQEKDRELFNPHYLASLVPGAIRDELRHGLILLPPTADISTAGLGLANNVDADRTRVLPFRPLPPHQPGTDRKPLSPPGLRL